MPCTLASAPIQVECDEIFNFALDQGHTILVNGVECVTLGHGFRDDVVRHAYYGTDRVITDLEQLDREQQNSGVIEIGENVLIRNQNSGLVVGLTKLQNHSLQQIWVQ